MKSLVSFASICDDGLCSDVTEAAERGVTLRTSGQPVGVQRSLVPFFVMMRAGAGASNASAEERDR